MAKSIESIREKYLGRYDKETTAQEPAFTEDRQKKFDEIRNKYLTNTNSAQTDYLNARQNNAPVSPLGVRIEDTADPLRMAAQQMNPDAWWLGISNDIQNMPAPSLSAPRYDTLVPQDRLNLGAATDTVKKMRSAINAGQNKQRYDEYMALAGNEDFEQKSQYSSKRVTNKRPDGTEMEGSYYYSDPRYEHINKNSEITVDYNNPVNKKYDQLTEDEVKVYNYIYETQGREAADDFLDSFDAELNARSRTDIEEHYAKQAAEEGALSTIGRNAIESPLKAIGVVGNAINTLTTGGIDQNAWYNAPSYIAKARDTAVMEGVTPGGEEVGKGMSAAGKFFYQTGESMANFITNALIGGAVSKGIGLLGVPISPAAAQNISLTLMSSQAAEDTLVELKDKGYSDSDAIKLSLLSGFAEYITEKVSLEALLNMDSLHSGKIAYLAKNFLAEGSEEVASDIINRVGDIIIMRDKSEWEQMIQQYIDQGYTRGQAVGLAIKDQAVQSGLSFLGGGLSGFAMAGGITLGSNVAATVEGHQFKKNNGSDALMELAIRGQYNDPASAAYKSSARLQNTLEKGRTPSSLQVGNVLQYQANANIEDKLANEVIGSAIDSIKENGYISDEDIKTIRDNAYAVQELQTVSPDMKTTKEGITEAVKAYADSQQSVKESNEKQYHRAVKEDIEDNSFSDTLKKGASMESASQAVRRFLGTDVEVENANKIAATVENDNPQLASMIRFAYNSISETSEVHRTPGEDFATAMIKAYNLGLEGKSAITLTKDFPTGAALFINQAHYAGTKAAEGGINGRTDSNINVSQRTDSPASAVESSGVAAEGQRENGSGSAGRKAYLSTNPGALEDVGELSNNEIFGDIAGSGSVRAVVPSKDFIDACRAEAKKVGYKGQMFFTDRAMKADKHDGKGEFPVDGYISKDNSRIYVNVRSRGKYALQTVIHELTHYDVREDKSKVRAFKDSIEKKAPELAKLIEEAYMRLYCTDKAYAAWEEAYCDAAAEINAFDGSFVNHEADVAVRENAAKISEAYEQAQNKRGPPTPSMTKEQAAAALGKSDVVGLETLEKLSVATWEATDVSPIIKDLAKFGYTTAEIERWISDIYSVGNLIHQDPVRLDYISSTDDVHNSDGSIPKKRKVSSFVSNSEYGGSIDSSTICAKRRLYTGTIEEIQFRLPNTVLTENDYLRIKALMEAHGLEVQCAFCYVEGSRLKLGEYTGEFLKQYKATNPMWMPTQADLATASGLENVRVNHNEVYEAYLYFMNNNGRLDKNNQKALFASQQKPKLYMMSTAYNGEIRQQFLDIENVKLKNRNGGIRFNSFSDQEIFHLIDTMQVILDMSSVGLAGQGYTKQPIFAKAFGGTGMKINLSTVAKGVDADGNIVFENTEGMNIDEALKIRNGDYATDEQMRQSFRDNVGIEICVFNDEQLFAAMRDPRIDFIIPFHRSQYSRKHYDKTGLTKKILGVIKDFTNQQNEKWLKPKEHTHEYQGRTVLTKCTNYMPNTYWDSKLSGKENAEKYLEMCFRDGKRPKFYKLLKANADGSYSLRSDGSTDGYWKLLSDYKMYESYGTKKGEYTITSKQTPQMPVKPIFNMDAIRSSMDSYQGTHRFADGTMKFESNEEVVKEFIAEKEAQGHMSRSLDIDGQLSLSDLETYLEQKYPAVPKEDTKRAAEETKGLVERIQKFQAKEAKRSKDGNVSGNVRTTALGITSEFIKTGYIDYSGLKLDAEPAKAAEQIATYSMVLRNPNYETFRLIYTKGDSIVGNAAVTSYMVDQGYAVLSKDVAESNAMIADQMRRLGADGYYLLHNHPSGDVAFSGADHELTKYYRSSVPGFKGHIIIDHNKYGFFANDKKLTFSQHEIKDGASQDYHKRVIDSPLLYKQIRDMGDVADMFASVVHDNNHSTLFYVSKDGVRAIQEVDNRFLLSKDFANYAKNRMVDFGSAMLFLAASNKIYNQAENLYRRGVFTDVVTEGGDDVFGNRFFSMHDYIRQYKKAEDIGLYRVYDNATRFSRGSEYDNKAKTNFGTMFSGTGTVDFALRNVINHAFAVEYDNNISAVYRLNNGDEIYEGDVRDAVKQGYMDDKEVDFLHASPVCKDYSAQKQDATETPLDLATAKAVADVIDSKQPKIVSIENVKGYKNSQAVKIIKDALDRNGYVWDEDTYKASDFGGSTIRERYFIRAARGVSELPPLPAKKQAKSWYEVTKDLIPNLKEMPLKEGGYLDQRWNEMKDSIDRTHPVLLLRGTKGGKLVYAEYDQPSPTIIAHETEARIAMPDGRFLEASPRVLARIQGLPDEFQLPKQKTLANKVVGNGVPVELTQAVLGSLLPIITGEDYNEMRFSRVTDPNEIQRLNSEPTVTVYRAMQVIDGKLYPPMAAKVVDETGKNNLVEPTELGVWYRADERPDLIKDGKFKLDKANGTSLYAAYNPYWHTSRSMLNDQFSSAYKRPNLVTVECEVPESELTSGYKAEFAKDSVGEMKWHSGPVSSKIAKEGNPRRVILSRWVKVNRIVPDSEAAASIANMLKGTDIAIPENTVTPSLKEELIKQGVTVGDEGQTRFSISPSFAAEIDAWDGRDRSLTFDVGTTSDVLKQVGLPDTVIKWHSGKLVSILNDHPEMDKDLFKGVPNILEAPVFVMQSRTDPKRVTIYGDLTAKNGKPVLAVLGAEIGSDGLEIDNLYVANAFGKDNPQFIIDNSTILYIEPDINKTDAWLTRHRLQLPASVNGLGLIKTIDLKTGNVNTRMSRASLPENADETAEKVVNNLYRRASFNDLSMKHGNYNAAAYTDERIEQEISYSYAEGSRNKDYARAYIAFVKPEDFIRATSSAAWRGGLYQEVATRAEEKGQTSLLDTDALKNERQSMFLRIDIDEDTGRAVIVGHEGRHRMIGLESEGYKYVPVIIEPREYGYPDGQDRYHTKPIYSLMLDGQEFSQGRGFGFVVHDLLPLSANYADIAREVFASGDNVTRFSRGSDIDQMQILTDDLKAQYAALQEELAKQTERAERYKGEMRLKLEKEGAYRYQITDAGLTKIEKKIKQGYSSSVNIRDDLRTLVNAVMNGKIEYDAAINMALYIGNQIVSQAKELVEYDSRYNSLREYLRKTKISINDSAKSDIPDYEAFRRRNLSRIRLTNDGTPIDVIYMELQEVYGKDLFPDGIDTQSEQLLHIDEVLHAIAPVMENMFTRADDIAGAVEAVAIDIISTVYNSDEIEKVAPTFADRQKRLRINAVEKARKETREMYERRIEAVRDRKDKRIQEMKDAAQRLRDRRKDSEMRTKLLNVARRLQNKKLPAVQRQLLDVMIGDLDTVSKSLTNKSLTNLLDLAEWYQEEMQDPDFLHDPITEARLNRLKKRQIADLTQEEVLELTQVLLNIENELAYEKKLIDSQERRDTYQLTEDIVADIRDTPGTRIGLLRKADGYFVFGALSGERAIRRMTGYNDNDPLYRLTLALSDGQRKMLDFQRRAYHSVQRFTEDKEFVESITGKKAKPIRISGMQNGVRVEADITPAERISLYLHSKNDNNLYHIEYGGITVPDFKLLTQGKIEEAYNSAKVKILKLKPSEVRAITAQMTDKERAFANAISEFYNGMSQKEINEVSEKLKGYSLAQVENYYPIETNDKFLTSKTYESLQNDGTIEGMGFLKERIQKSSTPIMLREAQQTMNQSVRMSSKYVGLAIPVRNISKVMKVDLVGHTEEGERDSHQGTIAYEIDKKWGEPGNAYLEHMITDLQNPRHEEDALGRLVNHITSNYAGAVLEMNAGVAVKQAASYPTAMAILGMKPLTQALTQWDKVDTKLIEKYTPLLWYRSLGYSTTELGDMASGVAKDAPTWLKWIQMVDIATTRKLWKASEIYVQQNNTQNLVVGSDDFYKEVAKVYNEVIEKTQPNYTVMQRPDLLRSKNAITRAINMFKTQPYQNFGILFDAVQNFKAKQTQYQTMRSPDAEFALKKARKDLANAIVSQLLSALVFVVMQGVWDVFRGKTDKYTDEDGKFFTWGSVGNTAKTLGMNMLTTGFGMIPVGSVALEGIEALTDKVAKSLGKDAVFNQSFYGMDVPVIATLNGVMEGMGTIMSTLAGTIHDAANGEDVDGWEAVRKIYKASSEGFQMAGLPVQNTINLLNAIAQNGAKYFSGDTYMGNYASLRIQGASNKQMYQNLYRAYKNDKAAYNRLYAKMIEDGYSETAIKSFLKKQE